MKKYKKPFIREIYLGTEDILDTIIGNSGSDETVKDGEGYEDMSKGNSGWDDWEE